MNTDGIVDGILGIAEPLITLAVRYWYVSILLIIILLLWLLDLVKYIPFIGG